MAAPKRSRAERERDLVEVAQLYLTGYSIRRIAAEISGQRDYSLTHSTIARDLATIRKQWQAEHTAIMGIALEEQLAKLDVLEAEAWDAWRRSQEDAVVVTDEDRDCGENPGTVHRTTRTGQCGDPRFQAQIERCIVQRCRLLGLEDWTIRVRLDKLEGLLHGDAT